MDNKQLIINHIKADIPLLITGKSGWGKTAIINEVAKELGMPIYDLPLSQIPAEDIMGIPDRADGYFKYLMPEWAHNILESGKTTILFLDEITQASVSVLHACFRLVNERVVAGHKLPIRVIAATNYSEENPELTELMEPLLRRFSRCEWDHNVQQAMSYLKIKDRGYNTALVASALNDVSPRELELALKYIDTNGLKGSAAVIASMTSPEMARALQDKLNEKESRLKQNLNMAVSKVIANLKVSYSDDEIAGLPEHVIKTKVNRICGRYNLSAEDRESVHALVMSELQSLSNVRS